MDRKAERKSKILNNSKITRVKPKMIFMLEPLDFDIYPHTHKIKGSTCGAPFRVWCLGFRVLGNKILG